MRNRNVNGPKRKGRQRERMKTRCMHKASDLLDMNGKRMSRDPRYQKLLNSKRWKDLRAWKLRQTEGYCEICYREGWRGIDALAVDIHHIVPVESVIDQGEEAMKRVCFNPANLMALCVRHHVEIHQQAGSHTKEAVNERKQKKRIGFLQRNDPNYKAEYNGIQTEIHERPFRESNTDRTCEAQAQANAKGNR